ncbi:hypothetical protein [Halorubrum spindle-shaped virus-BLv25]|nr:hypothetical protein [Halorubrum spindle-shaped virus-BLv25]
MFMRRYHVVGSFPGIFSRVFPFRFSSCGYRVPRKAITPALQVFVIGYPFYRLLEVS